MKRSTLHIWEIADGGVQLSLADGSALTIEVDGTDWCLRGDELAELVVAIGEAGSMATTRVEETATEDDA